MIIVKELEEKSKPQKNGMRRKMAVFHCDICGKDVVRTRIHGIQSKACSAECTRKRVAAQKAKREKPKKIVPLQKSHPNQPKECIGCGYWGRLDAAYGYCRYCVIEEKMRGCESTECKEKGIYTRYEQLDPGEAGWHL